MDDMPAFLNTDAMKFRFTKPQMACQAYQYKYYIRVQKTRCPKKNDISLILPAP
jgi:hypothetical protein